MGVKISKNLHFFAFFCKNFKKLSEIDRNTPVLNTFFALLDFGNRSEERRTKDEGRRRTEDGRQTRDEPRATN
jgi:hypothetical protein